tara:strand:+ start:1880 stop:2689 length:810 start_codon:yes stop_codon:yes gene_type:complete
MARARNIKPALFTNDSLADNSPLGRLLFIGLWTIADFKGDIEWRPKRVKAQVLPYDDCDIEKLAINLDHSGFIRFYSDGIKNYLRVVNFSLHQNPHKNERDKGSEIPAYSDSMRQAVDLKGLTINLDQSGSKWKDSASDPALSLIPYPDSLILNPDTLVAETVEEPPKPKQKRFVEPSLEDVRQYFFDQGELQSNEPQRFYDYYASNGWKVSSNKMKDWKAAARGWLSRNKSAGNNTFNQHPSNYPTMTSKASKREALTQSILSNDTSW